MGSTAFLLISTYVKRGGYVIVIIFLIVRLKKKSLGMLIIGQMIILIYIYQECHSMWGKARHHVMTNGCLHKSAPLGEGQLAFFLLGCDGLQWDQTTHDPTALQNYPENVSTFLWPQVLLSIIATYRALRLLPLHLLCTNCKHQSVIADRVKKHAEPSSEKKKMPL